MDMLDERGALARQAFDRWLDLRLRAPHEPVLHARLPEAMLKLLDGLADR